MRRRWSFQTWDDPISDLPRSPTGSDAGLGQSLVGNAFKFTPSGGADRCSPLTRPHRSRPARPRGGTHPPVIVLRPLARVRLEIAIAEPGICREDSASDFIRSLSFRVDEAVHTEWRRA